MTLLLLYLVLVLICRSFSFIDKFNGVAHIFEFFFSWSSHKDKYRGYSNFIIQEVSESATVLGFSGWAPHNFFSEILFQVFSPWSPSM